jgi:hypothetical protein
MFDPGFRIFDWDRIASPADGNQKSKIKDQKS